MIRRAGAVAAVLTAFVGCTQVREPPAAPVLGYPPTAPIDLAVCLVLDSAFRTAEWSDRSVANAGIAERYPLGEALARNAERMAQTIFAQVYVVEDAAQTPPDAQAVLTPRFAGALRTRPAAPLDDLTQIVLVEWWLRDSQGGLVWVETARGIGVAAVDRAGVHGRMASALEQLFLSSHRALAGAPEVHAFARRAREARADAP